MKAVAMLLLLCLASPAQDLWQKAVDLYHAERHVEAVMILEKLAGDGKVLTLLGICEFEIQDYGLAGKHLKQGLEAGLPNQPELASIGRMYLAWSALLEGDFPTAMRSVSEVKATPSNRSVRAITAGLAASGYSILPSVAQLAIEPSRLVQIEKDGERRLEQLATRMSPQ